MLKTENFRHTKWYGKLIASGYSVLGGRGFKGVMEFTYWWLIKLKEKRFTNHHYEEFYTRYFDLEKSFFDKARVLDIGCGPRGSLEWLPASAKGYGIDPLADKYLALGAKAHRMKYVKGESEEMPFEDGEFDLVASFNSLDHVDDLDASIRELTRVLKPGGIFLLMADIHDMPTLTEPSSFSWDIMEKFSHSFTIRSEHHYEGHQLYKSIRKGIPFNHDNKEKRYGVLTASFIKKGSVS